MHFLSNPSWIPSDIYRIKRYEEFPQSLFNHIKSALQAKVDYQNPLVSVVIAAKDEEVNIVKCLYFLLRNKTSYPFEILVINNNSTDRTQQILDELGVRSEVQTIPGCGPTRAMGLQKAKGKYILTADADCIYPKKWIELMTKNLEKPGTTCVYGTYSFLGDEEISRFKLWIHEQLRNVIARLRQLKRPYLNAFGMSMGFPKEMGIEAGVIGHSGRGEDGRLCFNLMQMGKVRWVNANSAKVWTEPRALTRGNTSLSKAMLERIVKELTRFGDYFKKKEAHDTNTSENTETSLEKNVDNLKKKFKMKS